MLTILRAIFAMCATSRVAELAAAVALFDNHVPAEVAVIRAIAVMAVLTVGISVNDAVAAMTSETVAHCVFLIACKLVVHGAEL
jgi:hypothetical protein